ncbi:MAG: hypothetical protein NT125_08690 [Candidatus Bipolaricaulota bacterium]|nr:hypothetical protein [Candidatus Bipolaricaulota bacterium]
MVFPVILREMERKLPPDWRLQAWSTLAEPFADPQTGYVFPVGAEVVQYSYVRWGKDHALGLPVPNGTAVFLSLSRTAYHQATVLLNDKGRLGTRGAESVFLNNADGITWTENMAAAVVFAVTALEAFANEMIPKNHIWTKPASGKQRQKRYAKEEIERSLPLDTKLGDVLPAVLASDNPRGTEVWERYLELKGARDRLIHLKDQDRRGSGPDADTVWGVLVSIPAPHRTSLALIDFLLGEASQRPHWRQLYPFED